MMRAFCGGSCVAPEVFAEVEEAYEVNDSINTGAITKYEIRSALGDMKSGKAPAIDNITADLLRTDTYTAISVLRDLFNSRTYKDGGCHPIRFFPNFEKTIYSTILYKLSVAVHSSFTEILICQPCVHDI